MISIPDYCLSGSYTDIFLNKYSKCSHSSGQLQVIGCVFLKMDVLFLFLERAAVNDLRFLCDTTTRILTETCVTSVTYS